VDDATNQAAGTAVSAPNRISASPRRVSSRRAGRRGLSRLIDAVYFERIALVRPDHLPRSGPVLYLGLHRNGAVDGFVYARVLRNPVFLISTQLRKNWLARIFFDGIAVTRAKDEGDRTLNEAALRQCLEHLRAGGELFVFPEGTSSLGPRHLPFKSGAAWLALDYLDSGNRPPLQVVPLGIHYECPWAFRSKVEVVAGPPVSTALPAGASRIERLKTLKRRFQAALEEVGINVPSEERQQWIQRIASIATLGTPRSYFASLKAMEKSVPENIFKEWRDLEPELREAKLAWHRGIPLYPAGPFVLDLAALLAISPIVLAAIALNLPAFAAGWYAGKKFPDDRNVISLWKILVGVPAFALWLGVVVVTLLVLGKFLWAAGYVAVTCAGVKLYSQFKKLGVAVLNAFRCPALRNRVLAFRQTVLQFLPDESL
jgi:1-acyl-sn-glycerol-3-phosphate acyltransferase